MNAARQESALFVSPRKKPNVTRTFPRIITKSPFSSAGIRLEFTTNSRRLAFGAKTTPGSSRPFCHYDLYVNGVFHGQVGADTTETSISAEWDLGEGEKEVKLYLPWSATTTLTRVILDNDASLIPAKKSRRMLIYGDSITQGYDTLRPSLSYASLLADALDAEAFDKGIGGERFRPALAEATPLIDPDLITVAYGTNAGRAPLLRNLRKTAVVFLKRFRKSTPMQKSLPSPLFGAPITPALPPPWEISST